MKRCQFCIQPIPLDATVCKFCTRNVNTDAEAEDLCRIYLGNVVKADEQRKRRQLIFGAILTVVIIGAILISKLGH